MSAVQAQKSHQGDIDHRKWLCSKRSARVGLPQMGQERYLKALCKCGAHPNQNVIGADVEGVFGMKTRPHTLVANESHISRKDTHP